MNQETIEIIREARKAGMQTAWLMFACLIISMSIIGSLFWYFINRTYSTIPSAQIEAEQVSDSGNNLIKQEIK